MRPSVQIGILATTTKSSIVAEIDYSHDVLKSMLESTGVKNAFDLIFR